MQQKQKILKQTILVTGGAGYIGSHTAWLLAQQGHQVIILDNLSQFVFSEHNQEQSKQYNQKKPEEIIAQKILAYKKLGYTWAEFVYGDCSDLTFLKKLYAQYKFNAIMHFAAFIDVHASATDPLGYYKNNTAGSLAVITLACEYNLRFIFSSTCAVYGVPQYLPLTEGHPRNPLNTYGRTKFCVELLLQDCARAYNLKFVGLRYFNAAGAVPEHNLREQHTPETHVIPLLLRAAQNNAPFYIFGDTYNTSDGTCVRDYVHVRDIAQAHVNALEYLGFDDNKSDFFNLGSGTGYTVRQLLTTAQEVTGKTINVITAPAREGDPACLVADPAKARAVLNWDPKYSDLKTIITSAL